MTEPRPNLPLHRVALLLAAATFPLIFLGGLVTSHQAGMSVPDWPNSYGYNMFLFPPSQWVGGIFYEHTHRLLGTVVGFLAVVLVAQAWGPSLNPTVRFWSGWLAAAAAGLAAVFGASLAVPRSFAQRFESPRSHDAEGVLGLALLALVLAVVWRARTPEPRRWVRWLTVAALVAVIAQGVLGGLRVVLVKLDLAIVHGCFAQACFCLMALLVVVTGGWWAAAPDWSGVSGAIRGKRLMRLAVIAVAVVFGQLVIGAVMRHYQAGLAIPDFPLAYGRLIPPTNQSDLYTAVLGDDVDGDGFPDGPAYRVGDSLYARWMRQWPHVSPLSWFGRYYNLVFVAPTALRDVWLHFAHRVGAVVVSVVLLWLVARVLRIGRDALPGLRLPALLLVVLLLTQLTLGGLTVLLRKPADVASAHVAVGALVLVTTFVLAVRAARLFAKRRSAVWGGFEPIIGRDRRNGHSLAPVLRGEGGGEGRDVEPVWAAEPARRSAPDPSPLP